MSEIACNGHLSQPMENGDKNDPFVLPLPPPIEDSSLANGDSSDHDCKAYPKHDSILPELPPLTMDGLPSKSDGTLNHMIESPLPPPVPIDTYGLEYGPVTESEPQLDSPLPSPKLDKEMPQFDELNQHYEFLRRTLSHSRTRYSARFKRPRPRPTSRDVDTESSLDAPGKLRPPPDQSSLDSPGKRRSPLSTSSTSATPTQRHKHTTVRGVHPHRDITSRSHRHDNRISTPARSRESRVDHMGRPYVLDHSSHTMNYDSSHNEGDPAPSADMSARREMLSRRYQSLQRSFRTGQHQRRQPANLTTPIDSVGAISYIPSDEVADPRQHSGDAPARRARSRRSRESRNQRRSNDTQSGSSASSSRSNTAPRSSNNKKSSWFTFKRKSHNVRSVHQTPSTADDNILTVSGHLASPRHSPLTPPPSVEEASSLAREERESGVDRTMSDSPEYERRILNQSLTGTDALLAAVSTPEASLTQPTSDTTPAVPMVTNVDRATALRAQQRLARGSRTSRVTSVQSGDTDEETNEVLSGEGSDTEQDSVVVSKITVTETPSKEHPAAPPKKELPRQLSEGLKSSPALKFITRNDLYSFLSSAGEAGATFFENKSLMELVQRIRSDVDLFEKYQHSRHLVQAINQFAKVDQDLPENWERKLNQQGRIFFIDHNSCMTTFIDPRLPMEDEKPPKSAPATTSVLPVPFVNVRRVHSVSTDEIDVRPHHSTIMHSRSVGDSPQSADHVRELSQSTSTNSEETTYEDQMVAFFRQPNVFDLISRRHSRGVRPQLRQAIEEIRQNGISALERIQLEGGATAVELTIILSMFEEDINALQPQRNSASPQPEEELTEDPPLSPKGTLLREKQAFSAKLQSFKLQLARLGFAQSSRLKFNIRRDHLLEDAYEHIMKSEIRQLQRKRLNITFKGEEGLDYGGPSREFFFLLSRELFNPYYGLFEYSANDTYTIQINSTSTFIQNNLDWFRFAGRVTSLVIAQGFLLDVFFTRPIYKAIIGRPATLKDLESLEPAFYNSLLWIQENDPEPLDLTFTVEEEAFGQLTSHELKEGGVDIQVLEENKHEYIDLMVAWRLDRGVGDQLQAFMKGFTEIMPQILMQQFDAQEVEFIIAGTLEIDVDDWKANTEYRNGYGPSHPVIIMFWQAVEMFDNEQRLRLLQFVTGTSSVPYDGFKALRGSSGPKRFTIDFFNDIRSLPRTHTCFNRLDLPPYPTFEILYEKLRTAIEEGATFGIE